MRGNTRRCQAENPLIALSSFLEPALDRQFDLPALLGVFAPARPQSRQRRLDAQRLNTLDHFRGNRTVDTKTAEGDAALHAVVDQGSSAVIARDVTFGPAVGDVQLASAVAATEQPG